MTDAAESTTKSPSDSTETDDDSPIKLFGDPRSAHVQRGPDRRRKVSAAASGEGHVEATLDGHPGDAHLEMVRGDSDRYALLAMRTPAAARALRLGRGDGFATALNLLGILLFGASVIGGGLILYNAKNVGAFSDPWNSNRVAIGIAVIVVGVALAALLVGLARALTYQLASLRLRMREFDNHGPSSTTNV